MSEVKQEVLFEAKNICKNFGITVALDQVSITVFRGEIRGLIGENGSGKSTLSSIAAGMLQPTKGEMFFKGEKHKPKSMIEAAELGIGMIVQEMGTISGISIAQNIFLGSEHKFRNKGLISKKAMNMAAKKSLENIGVFGIDPSKSIDTLDMQERKLIEVAKVMNSNPEILVVDETTTALSQKGRTILYGIMEKMKKAGKSVIFISHDLEETIEHCDALSVLRDGIKITTLKKEDFEENKIKTYMVGREIGEKYYREDNECTYDEEVIIDVKNLTTGKGLTQNVSFKLHKGEILGIGGLSHCGMHELGRAVFGEEKVVTGNVTHGPSQDLINDAKVAIKHEMGYVSKNRDLEGLVLKASVKENIIGASFDKVKGPGPLILPNKERKYLENVVNQLNIKCSGIDALVESMSGGNKQKVVFAKWIARKSKILVLDCPTRGVDIGVKAAMYELMESMKKEDKSIIMISEEMTELLGMCDRILVMRDGEISGELERGTNFNENEMLELMI